MELIGIAAVIIAVLIGVNLLFWIVSGIFSFIIWLISTTISNIFTIVAAGIAIYVILNII